MTYKIEVPIPDARLSPNARVHWTVKARLTKQARWTAMCAAQDATHCAHPLLAEGVTAQATIYVKDKRRRDADNYLARLKATFDGFTDAGLLADDRHLSHLPLVFLVDRNNPRCVITITGEPSKTLFTELHDKYKRALDGCQDT